MSWMGRWHGNVTGKWYGWAAFVDAVVRRVKLLQAKFVRSVQDEIFVRKTPDERTR